MGAASDDNTAENKGIDRRRMLQAGAAAGVGAVAWVSPSITNIGMAPAMAQNGTGGTVTLTNQRGLQVTGNDPCNNWGQASSQPKTFTVQGNNKVTVNIDTGGICIDGSAGTGFTSITAQPANFTCSITGISVSCNGGGSGPTSGTTSYPVGTTTVSIPTCPVGTGPNSFVFYNFTCIPN